MIDEEGGIEAVWHRHQLLADSVRAAVQAWAAPGGLSFNIGSPAHRSNAVTTVRTGDIDSIRLTEFCRRELGLTLGIGMPVAPDRSFRIAHMGHLNPVMTLGALGAIETALGALSAPMGGSGVAAAAALLGGQPSPSFAAR